MSKKSNQNQTPNKSQTSPQSESLDNDLDFWNMETDVAKIDESSAELDELENFLNSPVLPETKTSAKSLSDLSESPTELTELDDDAIIGRLTEANSKRDEETIVTLSDDDLKEYEQQEQEERAAITKQKVENKARKPKRTLIEKAATIVCVLMLLGFAYYFYDYYNTHLDIKSDDEWATNIPVDGEYASIESVLTGWSKPGSGAKLGVILVPTVTITLNNDSKSGAIRVVFYSYKEGLNGNKRAKGDPFPLEFKDGKFANGKKSITLQGTDGFTDIADFNLYRSQYLNRWTMTIKEAGSINTPAGDFEELGHAPIEPDQLVIK